MKELIILTIVLLGSRLIGLDANTSPILAVAVFMPYLTHSKAIQYLLPVSIMLVTDAYMSSDYMSSNVFLIVYGCMMLSTLLATHCNKYLATICGVLTWHILVNGAVVLTGPGFAPFTPEAMLFDMRLLISSLLYVGMFDILHKVSKEVVSHGRHPTL